MARFSQLLTRIDRVLELAERWLERRSGARLEPDLAARCTAFRWDARDGAGRLLPIEEMQAIDLDDLLGVGRSIAERVRNTGQFVRGLPYRFLVFCDDLSFDDGEPGMHELKVALEGSVETTPGNVRFALHRASRSGRVARHFVDDLAGRLALERAGGS